MTPAIRAAKQANIWFQIHEYVHDPGAESYGAEAAEKLALPPARVFKTLVVSLGNRNSAVGVIPVSSMLSMKLMAKAVGGKKAVMANKQEVERATGYVLGGVSPLGQKNALPTVIDTSAADFDSIFVSAGRRGLEIEVRPRDLQTLTRGSLASICQGQ